MLKRDDFTITPEQICDLCFADLRQQQHADYWSGSLRARMLRPCVSIQAESQRIDLCATHLLQLLARLIAQEPTP